MITSASENRVNLQYRYVDEVQDNLLVDTLGASSVLPPSGMTKSRPHPSPSDPV